MEIDRLEEWQERAWLDLGLCGDCAANRWRRCRVEVGVEIDRLEEWQERAWLDLGLSDHCRHQIRYWGICPSFGFVEEPETNGVAERWNRTLKEQAIHGRVFHNLEEVRTTVAECVERYNTTGRLEKIGGLTRLLRRASSTSYARRHSANQCPRNRVRYSRASRLLYGTCLPTFPLSDRPMKARPMTI